MYIYFIQEGVDGPIKIGKSRSPEKRMMLFQTGNSKDLRLLAKIEMGSERNALRIERKIHSAMRRFRIRGEWFKPQVMRAIKKQRPHELYNAELKYTKKNKKPRTHLTAVYPDPENEGHWLSI